MKRLLNINQKKNKKISSFLLTQLSYGDIIHFAGQNGTANTHRKNLKELDCLKKVFQKKFKKMLTMSSGCDIIFFADKKENTS